MQVLPVNRSQKTHQGSEILIMSTTREVGADIDCDWACLNIRIVSLQCVLEPTNKSHSMLIFAELKCLGLNPIPVQPLKICNLTLAAIVIESVGP
jgi:hypothetical protein